MSDQEYSVEREVETFFTKTTITRYACDDRALELASGRLELVPVQGVCSYTVYAGADLDIVVQFRLKSLALPLKTMELAHQIYGTFAPEVTLHGQIGEDADDGKEALYVYVMPRMRGISRIDFILAYGFPEDTPKNCTARLALVKDVASFFALSWNAPQIIDRAKRDRMQQNLERELRLLLHALPSRFKAVIESCLQALPSIMTLPMVLAHKDFGDFNMLVDPNTCNLLGVIDWAEAEIEPFGLNLYSVENLMGKFHLRNGALRYPNYDVLYDTFWQTLKAEVDGDISDDSLETIRSAMLVGFLRSNGFTSRLANMPQPVPISDDEKGAYNTLVMDSYLTRKTTRFPFLASASQ